MKVHVVGIGLIGGSMVLDIKSLHPEATIYGIDSNESHLAEAIALGVVDSGATFEDLMDADFVIVSVPVDVALKGKIATFLCEKINSSIFGLSNICLS